MVITKTPFRMSFFGGGTDFKTFYEKYGGSVISTTFDKYCYISTRHLPRFFEYSNQFVYSKIESIIDWDNIEHPLIRNTMKYMNMHEIRLSYDADLPAKSGLGTSSAFAVGMINAFHTLKGEYASKKQLANEAIFVERELCGEAGGIQDQIAAAYGGFNRISFGPDGYSVTPLVISPKRKQELNNNLLLFFTGISRLSFNIQQSTQKSLVNKTIDLLEMLKLVDEAEQILTSQTNLNEFGKLLDYTWKLKRSISNKVSTCTIDSLYKRAIEAGALGGKLLGAGGGGFFLFYVEADKQNKVIQSLPNLLHIPFNFEKDGARVIHYEHESWDQIGNDMLGGRF